MFFVNPELPDSSCEKEEEPQFCVKRELFSVPSWMTTEYLPDRHPPSCYSPLCTIRNVKHQSTQLRRRNRGTLKSVIDSIAKASQNTEKRKLISIREIQNFKVVPKCCLKERGSGITKPFLNKYVCRQNIAI